MTYPEIIKKNYVIIIAVLIIAIIITCIYGYNNWGWFGSDKSGKRLINTSDCPKGTQCNQSEITETKTTTSSGIPIERVPTRII